LSFARADCGGGKIKAKKSEKRQRKKKKKERIFQKNGFSQPQPSSCLFTKQKFTFSVAGTPPELGPGFFGMFPSCVDSQFVKMTTKICKLKTPFEMQRRFCYIKPDLLPRSE